MKQTETETLKTMPETETALAHMAEDIPPMPADFHDRWMSAVRAEAEKTVPPAEQKPQNRTVSITRWTRILSIAATFVFLIGGTLVYRGSKTSLAALRAAEKKAAVMAAETQANSEEQEEALAYDAVMDEYSAGDMDTDAGFILSAGASKDASAAAGAAMAVYAAGAPDEVPAMAENSEEEAEEYSAEEDVMASVSENESVMEVKGEMKGFSESADAAEIAEPVPSVTALPTEAVQEQQERAEEHAESSSFLQEAGVFLTDMGDFLLAALPYLAVLAVPAAAALIIRRRKK